LRVQVAGHQVRVRLEGQLRIGVPEDARDRVKVYARSEQQRRRGVPGVVQAELPRQRACPKDHPAARAAPPLAVWLLLLVRRASALAPSGPVSSPRHTQVHAHRCLS